MINLKQPLEATLKSLAQASHGTPYGYSRMLVGHFGCVNAIALSSGEANLLASGGDDCRVFVWNALAEPGDSKPLRIFKGHVSNLFCVEFDSTNRHLYSCGNDGFLLQYDLEHDVLKRKSVISSIIASDVNLAHENAVMKLSISPENDSVVLTARLVAQIPF